MVSYQAAEADIGKTGQGQVVPPSRVRAGRMIDAAANAFFILVFLGVSLIAYGTIPNRWYQVLVVTSGSMSPTIEAGDLIVITRPPRALEPGMVLTMLVNGGVVTHRLVGFTDDGGLITRGDANSAPDPFTNQDVRGLYRLRIPRLGYALAKPMAWLRGGQTSGSWFSDAAQVGFSLGAVFPSPTPTPTATLPPLDPGCTYSTGYWKNHPEAWPAAELALGTRMYDQAALLALLNLPARGDALVNLAQQLAAAKLNVLAGADPDAVQDTITAADDFLALYPPGSDLKKDNAARKEANRLAGLLEAYNSGEIGPGHCANEPEEEGIPEIAVQPVSETPPPDPGLPSLPAGPDAGPAPTATLPALPSELPPAPAPTSAGLPSPTAGHALPTVPAELPTAAPTAPALPPLPPPPEPTAVPTEEPTAGPTAPPEATEVVEATAEPPPEPTAEESPVP